MTQNKVVKNASWIIVCKIIESIISLFIGMLTARYLGPSNYGLINYAASVVAFVVPIMQLGINNILVQEFVNSKDREGQILGTTMLMSFISSLLCITGIIAFSFIVNRDEIETIIVCILYSLLLIFQSLECTKYWFQAQLKAKYPSVAALVIYALISVYKIYILATHKTVYWFALTGMLDYLLMAVALFVLYKKLGGQPLSISWATGKQLFSKGKYYIVSSMLVTIFAQTDKIMLKTMLNSEVTGYYSAAVTCAGLTSFVFLAILDSLRPVIFESQKSSHALYEQNMVKLYSIMIYLSLFQCIIMTLFAPFIVFVLYGQDYYPTIQCLQISVWYTTFSYLGAVRNIWMLAENKQKYLWIINLFGALTNVILNLILIPLFAERGAAIASLITQFFTNVVLGFIIAPIRYNNKLMMRGLNIKYFLSTIGSLSKRGDV